MTDTDAESLKLQFMRWQCRSRQHAVREESGRPNQAMQPEVVANGKAAGQITTVLNRLEPAEHIQHFRFIVKKTQDPKARADNGIKLLSEYYYHDAAKFTGSLNAVFSVEDDVPSKLAQLGEVQLHFRQDRLQYELHCSIHILEESDSDYQLTYWHNHMFNPAMPGKVQIVQFKPNWDSSSFSNL